ncbi:nucleotidyl transferase AbiEii/AbiGii toxin family protein [Patescibacteria group bacterium]|nr:nucleotidyl transferase AbiEii/AbiGii toxin family protein [Patescibacteria group bacterium]
MLKEILKDIVAEKRREGAPDFVIKNFLKEYLQYPVMDFIYNSADYKNFIFTGGSCLRICFNAPRLSEDLDFDIKLSDYKKFKINKLAEDLQDYFKRKFLINAGIKIQSDKRVYIKFSVLKELGLAEQGESDLLYVKIEPGQSVFTAPKLEFQPISRFGFNFIAKRYNLEFLMTGKLNAIFSRQWFKGKANEINIKGRDFYDLFWYLENNVKPNYNNLKNISGIADEAQLKKKLIERIAQNVTARKLSYDLKNFFPNQNFVNDFCRNYKKIIEKFLQ